MKHSYVLVCMLSMVSLSANAMQQEIIEISEEKKGETSQEVTLKSLYQRKVLPNKLGETDVDKLGQFWLFISRCYTDFSSSQRANPHYFSTTVIYKYPILQRIFIKGILNKDIFTHQQFSLMVQEALQEPHYEFKHTAFNYLFPDIHSLTTIEENKKYAPIFDEKCDAPTDQKFYATLGTLLNIKPSIIAKTITSEVNDGWPYMYYLMLHPAVQQKTATLDDIAYMFSSLKDLKNKCTFSPQKKKKPCCCCLPSCSK